MVNNNFCINLDDLEKINCPLCAGREFSVFRDIFYRKRKTGRMFKIVKCRNCGLVYLNPRVKKEFIKAYYPGGYYHVNISNPEDVLKTSYEKEKLVLMKNFSLMDNKEGSLLDVGCSKGEFLENLKRYGWKNLRGVEFNGDCVEFAKERYNLDIFMGEFEDYSEEETFDVITFWHSLEHFYDINSAVDKVDKLLKDDGALIISVPDIKSIQARIMGKYWYHIEAPRHTIYFDKTSLGKLLQRHNFLIKKCVYGYPAHTFAGWHLSFLNIWNGFKIKYAMGKNIGFQPPAGSELSSHKVLPLRLLKRIMNFLGWVEMAIGSGAVITIVARRGKCR